MTANAGNFPFLQPPPATGVPSMRLIADKHNSGEGNNRQCRTAAVRAIAHKSIKLSTAKISR
jgi:hypothetical protein